MRNGGDMRFRTGLAGASPCCDKAKLAAGKTTDEDCCPSERDERNIVINITNSQDTNSKNAWTAAKHDNSQVHYAETDNSQETYSPEITEHPAVHTTRVVRQPNLIRRVPVRVPVVRTVERRVPVVRTVERRIPVVTERAVPVPYNPCNPKDYIEFY